MATVADIRKKLEKLYKDDIELFPDLTTIKACPVVKSPSAIINAVTGIGGFPRGRMTEVFGPFSSGKTTIVTETIAETQRENPDARALLLDYEQAWDAMYARKLGTDLNPDRLIWAQPTYFEQGADIAIEMVREELVDMIVIDSAAAMTPRSEMEGKMDIEGGTQKGTQASLMARFLERITKMINRGRKPALVILNQTRANIQIGGPRQKNAPREQSAAGNAIKFYASMRLELEIIAPEGETGRGTKGTDQVYTQNRVRVKTIKNKLAPPHIRGNIVIEYGKGINNIVSVAELAEAKLGIMSGSGYFNYAGDTPETNLSCRGREVFQERLTQNPALLHEIEGKVLATIRQEHAEALGLDEIKQGGNAKEMEPGTLTLTDAPDQEDGPGMPTIDA
jgi:recombination protein RecA